MEKSVEIKNQPESWRLQTIESSLCLDCLRPYNSWFVEGQPPTVITKEMLTSVPGFTQELINRLKMAEDYYKDWDNPALRINERMNPFRGNNLTAILTPALDIFVPSNKPTDLYLAVREYLGDQSEAVRQKTDKLVSIAQYRKLAGQYANDIADLIEKEQKSINPRGEVISELETALSLMTKDSMFTPEEVSQMYSLGKLASNSLRAVQGKNQLYVNKDVYLEELSKALPDITKRFLKEEMVKLEKYFS